jgi:plastocyanin
MKRFSLTLSVGALLLVLAGGLGLAAESAGPKNHVVRIEGMKFTPGVISARPGDTVEFLNIDLVPHTVTERSVRAFDSGMINAKKTWKFVAEEEGVLDYRCIYHPDMMGRIVVGAGGAVAARRAPAKTELCGGP